MSHWGTPVAPVLEGAGSSWRLCYSSEFSEDTVSKKRRWSIGSERLRVGRVPQQVKGLAAKPGNQSSVPGTHVVEGRRELGPASRPLPATCTQKLINKCNLSSKSSTATREVSGQGRLHETLHERKREDCCSPQALTRHPRVQGWQPEWNKTYWSCFPPLQNWKFARRRWLLSAWPSPTLLHVRSVGAQSRACNSEDFSSRKVYQLGGRDICLRFQRRWEKSITRNRRAELAGGVWLVIKVKQEMVFWTLKPRKWACQSAVSERWHLGTLGKCADKRIIIHILISGRKSLRLLEILDKARGRACRNINMTVGICGRFPPADAESAFSPVVTVRGHRVLNITFRISPNSGYPQQEFLGTPYLSPTPSVPFSLSLPKIHYPRN